MFDLKNAKTFWTKITKRKVSKNDAKKLYNKLIQKDIQKKEKRLDIINKKNENINN